MEEIAVPAEYSMVNDELLIEGETEIRISLGVVAGVSSTHT